MPVAESSYTQEMADRIVDWISDGRTLRAFCRQEEVGIPCFKTVYVWLKEQPEFAKAFSVARDVGFDVIAEEALAIVDEKPTNKIELGHQRLRLDARLKLLAKWSPKRYGEMMKLADPDGRPLRSEKALLVVSREEAEAIDRKLDDEV